MRGISAFYIDFGYGFERAAFRFLDVTRLLLLLFGNNFFQVLHTDIRILAVLLDVTKKDRDGKIDGL